MVDPNTDLPTRFPSRRAIASNDSSCGPACDGNSRPSRRREMRFLAVDFDLLTPAKRRDLANALLRAAWRARLGETRVVLLDSLIATHATAIWEARG
jgi:hypothetical protein